jgi:hypothetical protein
MKEKVEIKRQFERTNNLFITPPVFIVQHNTIDLKKQVKK